MFLWSEFLGHIVSKDGIKLGQKKVDGLIKLSEPKDKQTLRSFLGLTKYFREFIPFYADKVSLFEKMISKNAVFEWTRNHQEAFQRSKRKS
jgi:hypothetical protein